MSENPRECSVQKTPKEETATSVSSASSCVSDSSEEIAEKISVEDDGNECGEGIYQKACRSMSDGAASTSAPNEEIFPSLPDSVLEKLGVLGSEIRDNLSEEEIEQKFSSLALAFSIDSTTIKDRCSRQRRYRDQTETNTNVEIERLLEKIGRMQYLCVNAETTELLTAIISQVDVVNRAINYATIAAERFGAVQHEEKISETVTLMIHHVAIVKRQRDSAKRQLQYTKKVLQDTNTNTVRLVSNQKTSSSSTNKSRVEEPIKRIDRRRASIATIQTQNGTFTTNPKCITRRTSDLSLKALIKASRPSRLELGVDLVKIKEGLVEGDGVVGEEEMKFSTPAETPVKPPGVDFGDLIAKDEEEIEEEIPSDFTGRMFVVTKKFWRKLEILYEKWCKDGTLHDMFIFCAIICFSFSLISLSNVLIELELSKVEVR